VIKGFWYRNIMINKIVIACCSAILFSMSFVMSDVLAQTQSVTPTSTEASETPPLAIQEDETLYTKSFLEYNLSLEEYRKAHEEYLLRRSQYLKFKTLTSQQDAYNATLLMLSERDTVIKSYLEALRLRINTTTGVSFETKSRLGLLLKDEIDWYIGHESSLASAQTLENLVADSDEAKARYTKTKVLVYETLYEITNGRVDDYKVRLDTILDNLQGVLDAIKNDDRTEYQFTSRKIVTIERFLLDSENGMIRSSDEQARARASLEKLQDSEDGLSSYNSMVISLTKSQQFFKEVTSYLKEVVREVKTSE
jgi:hypothetical protein